MRLKEFLKDGGSANGIDSQWNSMSIADRTNYIKGDLLRRGYTQNQTAAILGNLLQENRSLHTHTANASSGALGIAQWLGGRKKEIISQGKHSTISGQLDFLDSEIRGKGAWTNNVGGKTAFFKSDDPRELTYIFRKDFERPGEHEANDNRRLANTFQVLGKAYTPTQYDSAPQQSIPSDMRPVDIKSQVAQNPEMIQYFSPEAQSQIAESYRLDNEKQKQEQIKSEYEYQNQQIQQALQEKQKQREQILSMIPQSAFVGSASGNQANPLKLMQKGGWVPFSERKVNPEPIRQFYNDMINAPWYKARLEANGYNSKLNPGNWFSDGAQDEADYRSRRVQYMKVHKIDKSKLPYSAEENERYKGLDQYGTNYDTKRNEVSYQLKDQRLDEMNIEPYSVISHEMGHGESAGRINSYESGLLTDRLSNRTKDDHDRSPEENKADINTLRYNLYRKGLYDPKTGKYKTKTGKFDNTLLNNVSSDFIIKRLQQNYNPADLEFLVNTIAYNDIEQEQPVYAQKGGKVVSEIWKEKTGTDWSEAKRLGLTDGSYDKNIQLLSRLRNNDPELINAVPQEVVQQQQQTPQQPKLTFNDLPNNLIPDVNTDTEYYSWAKDKQAVTDSNTSLNQLEREGHVELIKGKDNKVKTDVNGNYLYKILTNEYKDTFNNWIKTLNTKDNPQPAEKKTAPVTKTKEKPNGFLSSIEGLISDFANSTDQTLDSVGNTISEGASDVKDLFQQAYSYADRHFLDNTEVNTKKLVATKQPTVDTSKPTHVFDDQINMTDIEVGKGKAASGIINLNSNKFVTRNRGDHSEVKGGKGIAVTLFNPMNKDIENSYKQFPEVMALKKDGSIEIMARDKVTKDKVESITRADRMPWDKLEVVERNGKQFVKVEDSPDFKGKVVSMGGYNSGLGVGKWDKDYVPIDEANKYSKLIGGKVVMKSGDQEILVTGSFKDMYDAYKTLEKKTKQKPVVYKLDNGSFNTTYFKDNNMIDSEDLREHQNRNRAGGHALILLNK